MLSGPQINPQGSLFYLFFRMTYFNLQCMLALILISDDFSNLILFSVDFLNFIIINKILKMEIISITEIGSNFWSNYFSFHI